MKITVDFSELDEAVEVMGAKQREFTLDRPDVDFREVTIEDVDIGPDGRISIEGLQVLLYIQDHGWRINEAIENPEKGNKYHVSYCQTLERMKNIGRYEKYVATNKTSGDFFITGIDSVTKARKEATVRLKVCQNCLSKLDYKN